MGAGGLGQSAMHAAGGTIGTQSEVGPVKRSKAQPLSINPLAIRAIRHHMLTLYPLRTRYSVDRGALCLGTAPGLSLNSQTYSRSNGVLTLALGLQPPHTLSLAAGPLEIPPAQPARYHPHHEAGHHHMLQSDHMPPPSVRAPFSPRLPSPSRS